MAESAEKESKGKKIVKETLDVAGKVVKTGLKIDEIKHNAPHIVEDGVFDAKRMIKKGRYAAEDLVEDTAHYIKHDPLRSVGVTFAVGFGLGTILGLLMAKNIIRKK